MAKKYISKYTGPEIDSGLDNIPKLEGKLTELESKVQEDIASIKPIVINGDVVNAADEEDITSEDNLLKLKDRDNALGMGYVILRKNKTFAEQVTLSNTIYEIRYDFDLDGEEIIMPTDCVLLFVGGSLSDGTIIGNNVKIKGSDCLRNVIIKGEVHNNIILMDWFQNVKITEADYINNIIIDSFLTDLISAIVNEGKSHIEFGSGIYGFTSNITFTNVKKGLIIRGRGVDNTCLYFPQSEGLFFQRGDLGHALLCGMTIHSEGECIKFHCATSDDRFNAVHDSCFQDLKLLSNSGDYAIGADNTISFFLYHNTFKNVMVYGKNGFCRLSGLGTIYDNVCDNRQCFVSAKTMPRHNDMSIFYNCKDVVWQNSNSSYASIAHVYKFDFSVEPAYGCRFEANNCNMEGFTKEFVITEGQDGSIGLVFSNCVFISAAAATEEFTHIHIGKVTSIKGVNNKKSVWHINQNVYLPLRIEVDDYSMYNGGDYAFSDGSSEYTEVDSYVASGKFLIDRMLVGSTKMYFSPKRHSDSDIAISRFGLHNIVTLDLTAGDKIEHPYATHYYITADSNHYTCNIPSYSALRNRSFNTISSIGSPLILFNNSKYCVEVKWGLYRHLLPPKSYFTWFAYSSYIGLPKINAFGGNVVYCNLIAGEEINGLVCVEANCGFYTTATLARNTVYDSAGYYSESPIATNSYVKRGDYIYCCVSTGRTSESDVTYSEEYNTITTDGTAQFLCLGKIANMQPKNGTTRPAATSALKGFCFFDFSLNKPIWCTGSSWVDATGASV